ncbi:tripeptidyl peptidase SED3 [Microthyrium microscopicum]|uniref:tripeptidyl-peptidase II n=1 Tax=Microthyrium microscopicum TaxID=703497 RepID=A0A6A6USH1_9PEZI|nr:tripeptidyl peptidase SED3 [Microthyrium microscopicum]
MLLQGVTIGLLTLLAQASPASLGEFATFGEIHSVPEGWTEVGAPAASAPINFRVALNEEDPTALERTLREVSSPDSPKYGQHLKREELQDIVKPSEASKRSVQQWLKRSGVKNIEARDNMIHFTATAEQANAMMNTKFRMYRRDGQTANSIRTTKVALPRSVLEHVKMIHPTTYFSTIQMEKSTIATSRIMSNIPDVDLADETCARTVTPTCLRRIYNIPSIEIKDPSKTGILGVAGFLNQLARLSDFATFAPDFAPWATSAKFDVISIEGGSKSRVKGIVDQQSSASSEEANLDVQYSIPISYPVTNKFYSTGGKGFLVPDADQPTEANNDNEPYLDFFQYIANATELPHTITVSYGENEQSVPKDYASTVCDLIGQLGTRGTTVIFASGDSGPGSSCKTNDGKNTTRFLPSFPAACPYVTAVGGTTGAPERAVGLSSGGFSDRWKRPWYQEKQVTSYLAANGQKWSGLYNAEGRGFPDIAAQATGYVVIDKGSRHSIGGTSASAPVIAGIVALLNAKRLQDGQPTLGFLNPWIYQYGDQTLNDIKIGASSGCSKNIFSPLVPGASWAAVAGWDPVTGMGTPNVGKMLEFLPKNATTAPPTYTPPPPPESYGQFKAGS